MELGPGFFVSVHDLPKYLVAILAKGLAHIGHSLLCDVDQERCDLRQVVVVCIVIPRGNEDSVVWLADKVVRDIVNYDCFIHVPAEQRKVLHKERSILGSVLTVKSVCYVAAHVDLINHLVGIFLHRSCKNDDFIILRQSLDELNAAWPC